MKKTCANCKFWTAMDDESSDGTCRKDSPALPMLVEQIPADDPHGHARGFWPVTNLRDWCDDHEHGWD